MSKARTSGAVSRDPQIPAQWSRPALNWTESATVNVALPTFTFPLDHEQHPRTGDAGLSPSMRLSAAPVPSRPRNPVVTGMAPELLYGP